MLGVNLLYRGNYYKFYDLDNEYDLEQFKKLYTDSESYVIFRSSKSTKPGETDHYWGIIDRPYKNIKNIFKDTYWKKCNDSFYVRIVKSKKKMCMRLTYENLNRKPCLIETHGAFSKDFDDMLKDIKLFINNHALELSVLIHGTNELMTELKKIKSVVDLNNKLKKIKKY